jgi:hypothetical protein
MRATGVAMVAFALGTSGCGSSGSPEFGTGLDAGDDSAVGPSGEGGSGGDDAGFDATTGPPGDDGSVDATVPDAPMTEDATPDATASGDGPTEASSESEGSAEEASAAGDGATEASSEGDGATEAASASDGAAEAAGEKDAEIEAAGGSDAGTDAATEKDAAPEASTTADAGTDSATSGDAATKEGGVVDAGSTKDGGDAGCTMLTVYNLDGWCSITVNGTPLASQEVCVAPGPVTLVATPAGVAFEIGPDPWYNVGDAGVTNHGTGTTETSTTTVDVSGATACVAACCPFTDGSGCTGTAASPGIFGNADPCN